MRVAFIFSFFLLLANISVAQSKTDKPKKQDNAFAPFSPEETAQPHRAPSKKLKKNKKKKNPYAKYEMTREQKIDEFAERMEANAKKYKKDMKEAQKPQYSDPTYFGHKRKPKIRKVNTLIIKLRKCDNLRSGEY